MVPGDEVQAQRAERAFETYMEKAEEGYLEAQFFVGYMYYTGTGVEQSNEKALEWFRKAADGGEPNAEIFLDLMYREGEAEAPEDDDLTIVPHPSSDDDTEHDATYWYTHAASRGDSDAAVKWRPVSEMDERRINTYKRGGILRRIPFVQKKSPHDKVNGSMSKVEILRQYQELASIMMDAVTH